ncbi:MAG: hypothetical protein HFF89_07420, partial [Oscillibacter sp.]|nr:hypothetical protein [Oscillibacter sp.]
MRRFICLLLILLLLLSGCAAPAATPDASGTDPNAAANPPEAGSPTDPEAPENPESPENAEGEKDPEPAPPEFYEIRNPAEEPAGGSVDGVPYAAWEGIVEHLFFHPVVAYPELAFDGDGDANGIVDYMVTVVEYYKILHSVYEKGYVLVDIG